MDKTSDTFCDGTICNDFLVLEKQGGKEGRKKRRRAMVAYLYDLTLSLLSFPFNEFRLLRNPNFYLSSIKFASGSYFGSYYAKFTFYTLIKRSLGPFT